MAASIGYFVGVMFAAAGVGYIWLGILWLVRVYKRWPRGSVWSAAVLAGLVGALTASGGNEPILTLLATAAAVGFILWRGASVRTKAPPPAAT